MLYYETSRDVINHEWFLRNQFRKKVMPSFYMHQIFIEGKKKRERKMDRKFQSNNSSLYYLKTTN